MEAIAHAGCDRHHQGRKFGLGVASKPLDRSSGADQPGRWVWVPQRDSKSEVGGTHRTAPEGFKELISEGHPQTPAREGAPSLDSPLVGFATTKDSKWEVGGTHHLDPVGVESLTEEYPSKLVRKLSWNRDSRRQGWMCFPTTPRFFDPHERTQNDMVVGGMRYGLVLREPQDERVGKAGPDYCSWGGPAVDGCVVRGWGASVYRP